MFFLIATLCASASMTDCTVYSMGTFETMQQCEVVKQVHHQVLGTGPDQNYRLECQAEEEGADELSINP